MQTGPVQDLEEAPHVFASIYLAWIILYTMEFKETAYSILLLY
jgi:hypothetical protein